MATKRKLREQTDQWLFMLEAFRRETENFTLDIDRLSDDELVMILGVNPGFLLFAPVMFHALHEKHHAELRRMVAYLNHLNALQAAAWKRVMPIWEAELKESERRLGELEKLNNGSR